MDLSEVQSGLADSGKGLWFDLHDSKFKIAYIGNDDFQRAVADRTLNGEIDSDVFCDCLAEYILVDWVDVFDPQGGVVLYSKEMASHALLVHEELREFVIDTCADGSNFNRVLA